MLRIRKNDTVIVIAGKDKGKRGRVLKVFPYENRVVVEGVNIVKKAVRPTPKAPQGGIIAQEMPLHISNVMLFCSHCEKGVRFGTQILNDGSKIRICRRCGEKI
ncbi:MAG: 50S ribosomal protein L24 [Candidatus Omnitrophota bacterium]|nr:MAG: 50S ribosomal protein L24 [Candidatus Omnitrophota bacterium]